MRPPPPFLIVTLLSLACGSSEGASVGDTAATDPLLIAVVPFPTIGDSGGGYFGVGLAAELERTLGSVGQLPTQPWSNTSAPESPDKVPGSSDEKALRELGTRLGVTHVIGGNI